MEPSQLAKRATASSPNSEAKTGLVRYHKTCYTFHELK